MRAAKLLDRGISQAETARQVKVSRQSVHRWALQILKQGGADGLKRAGRAGRRPRLGARKLKRLESILREGPEKAGFPNGLWTLDRIAWIIKEQFGVKYHTAQVWRILRQKLGWSCQRRSAGRASATKRPSATGRRTSGRLLKKSPKRGPHHRLRRRKWSQSTASSSAHLVAARRHAGLAASIQLGQPFHRCRSHAVAVLFPVI